MKTFKNICEDKNKLLSSYSEVEKLIDNAYERDAPEYEEYLLILKSLKRKPLYLSDVKPSRGKYDSLVVTEKNGLKRKFLIEFDLPFMKVYKKENRKDMFYKDYDLRDLF